jgi:hypothetical protein
MKTIIFFFTMLASITARATVTITPISVDYSTQKVTFNIAWNGAVANNRVWVWVDLCPVAGTTAGSFAKAVISEATGSGIVAGTLNGRGFYVNVNPSTVTATLSNATGKFNWCAYGSDFPPNVAAVNSGTYTLKGTPSFEINGAPVSGNQYAGSITTLTDPTGCPGCIAIRDFQFSTSNLSIPCCPNLTAANGYCRDLVADNSTVCGGYEVKGLGQTTYANCNLAGWTMMSNTELYTCYHAATCMAAWVRDVVNRRCGNIYCRGYEDWQCMDNYGSLDPCFVRR